MFQQANGLAYIKRKLSLTNLLIAKTVLDNRKEKLFSSSLSKNKKQKNSKIILAFYNKTFFRTNFT